MIQIGFAVLLVLFGGVVVVTILLAALVKDTPLSVSDSFWAWSNLILILVAVALLGWSIAGLLNG